MAEPERFEILILGSGAGGKLLAWHMARSGRRTAVVERRWIGGSCPNINCMPTKNEIWGAKVAHLVRHAAQFGTMTGSVAIDMARVRQRKREMVEAEIADHVHNYKTSGAELIMGSGTFVAPKTLEVRLNDGGTRLLAGDQVFINVGTHSAVPGIPGLDAARPMTNIEALELDYVPPHLIVLGGGYVGLEMAQAFRRFGSDVTVIEHGAQLMQREDPDVAHEVEGILGDEGVHVLVTAQIAQVHGRSTRGRLVPFCMFTDPPLARVGLSEGDAKRQGIAARVARLPVSAVLRAHTTDERRGFMKALVGTDDRILGFAMIGADADGVLAAVQTAMLADLPYQRLRDAILTHPTMGEGLGSLFGTVPPRP